MFCLSAAHDGDVICDSDTSLAFFKDLIHLLLEDVLGTDQAKGESQEDTQSAGPCTWVITLRHSILSSSPFLNLWMQGNGAFPGGMYHRMAIMMESDLVFAGESANAHESIWELLDQVRGCSRLGCGCCSGNRCRTCAGLPECDGAIHLHDCQFFT